MTVCAGVTALGLALLPGGCGAPEIGGIEDLPLPGGADLGSDPYEITAEFRDVVSLFPHASVKVNDVAVGRVTKISLNERNWTAKVTMRVHGKVKVPADAYANLEQSSLLGEKYVQLVAPAEAPAEAAVEAAAADKGRLRDGAKIPLSRTNRNSEVEEVFGALSLLLNGGGVQQLRTITTELNKALNGNEPEARSMLRRVNTLAKNLDTHKGDITDALDGVNELSSTLSTRHRKIGTVLEDLGPGLDVLEEQRGSLVTMLRSLDTLSSVAVRTVDRSKKDLVADLRALAPTLRNLADAGQDLPDSLQVMFTYPFTDEVLTGVKGDYLNVYLKVAAAPGTEIIPPATERDGTKQGTAAGAAPLPLPSVGGTRDARGGES
ncbi:MCE family protein [Streptomyces sp. N2-109]|uniref:MCE family protein n=1 Tax=Streptomyces gossypii TaxID=2883101 RepID=A0ABT2JWX4_9ACTN|nr:MCE family protein [Streptomyces gossypii]MCT2592403.1 MCE family protein [Streptomyces gossypii]